jgi:hypothetical protein
MLCGGPECVLDQNICMSHKVTSALKRVVQVYPPTISLAWVTVSGLSVSAAGERLDTGGTRRLSCIKGVAMSGRNDGRLLRTGRGGQL